MDADGYHSMLIDIHTPITEQTSK